MRVSLREEREETKSLFKHEAEKTVRMAAGRPGRRGACPTQVQSVQSRAELLSAIKQHVAAFRTI